MRRKFWALVFLAAAMFFGGRASALELRIRNDFGYDLSTAVVYYDDASGAWRTRGWYIVGANSSKTYNFSASKPDIYLHSRLPRGNKWGKGDVSRVVISGAFNYRDGEECPAGADRRSEKFTKYTAKKNIVNYRPVDDSAPLPSAGGPAAPLPEAGGARDELAFAAANIVSFVNDDRTRAGVKELASGDRMKNAALTRARELARNNDLSVRPDGRKNDTIFADNGIVYAIAYTCGSPFDDGNPLEIFQAFRANETTRKHMLSRDYTDIGVGIHEQGGRYYCVQILCGPKEPEKNLSESMKELERSLKELGDLFK